MPARNDFRPSSRKRPRNRWTRRRRTVPDASPANHWHCRWPAQITPGNARYARNTRTLPISGHSTRHKRQITPVKKTHPGQQFTLLPERALLGSPASGLIVKARKPEILTSSKRWQSEIATRSHKAMPPASCSPAPHSAATPLNVRVPRRLPGAPVARARLGRLQCRPWPARQGFAAVTVVPFRRAGTGRAPPVLRAIAPDASLAGAASSLLWLPLRQLFGAFAEIRGRPVEDDESAAPEAPGTDSHARHRRPEVPAERRPRSSGSIRRASARLVRGYATWTTTRRWR